MPCSKLIANAPKLRHIVLWSVICILGVAVVAVLTNTTGARKHSPRMAYTVKGDDLASVEASTQIYSYDITDEVSSTKVIPTSTESVAGSSDAPFLATEPSTTTTTTENVAGSSEAPVAAPEPSSTTTEQAKVDASSTESAVLVASSVDHSSTTESDDVEGSGESEFNPPSSPLDEKPTSGVVSDTTVLDTELVTLADNGTATTEEPSAVTLPVTTVNGTMSVVSPSADV
jgi:hypothetical protein